MNKFIKKAALMIPFVRKYHRHVEDLRSQVEDLHDENEKIRNQTEDMRNQIEALHNQNEQINAELNTQWNLKKQLVIYESMLDDIHDSVVMNKKICCICSNEIRTFFPMGENLRKNAYCPICGCLERHRTLWRFLEKNTDLFDNNRLFGTVKLLHFAPEPFFYNKISSLSSIDYYPVDFNSDVPGIRDVIDIQNIKYDDDMFNVIICYHVLEHIPNDNKAMRELHRVLNKIGGG